MWNETFDRSKIDQQMGAGTHLLDAPEEASRQAIGHGGAHLQHICVYMAVSMGV